LSALLKPSCLEPALPFLVNANFIPDSGRKYLEDNEWNLFLIRQIAYYHLALIKDIATINKIWRRQALELLASYDLENVSKKKQIGFRDGFKKGLKEIEFVPVMFAAEDFCGFADCIIDKIAFFEERDWPIAKQLLNRQSLVYSNEKGAANLNILNELLPQKIKNHNINFNFALLVSLLAELDKQTVELNFKLFTFLQKNCTRLDLLDDIKQLNFILTESGEACKPSELYLGNTLPVSIRRLIDVKLMHPDLAIQIDEDLAIWLGENLDIKEKTKIEILRDYLFDKLDSSLFEDTQANIEIVKFIFAAYLEESFDEDDYIRLRGLKLLTTKGSYLSAVKAYLPDELEPTIPLEEDIAQNVFVTIKYLDDLSESNKDKWRGFFLKIGVKGNITVHFEESVKRGDLINIIGDPIKYYFEYLKQNNIPGSVSNTESTNKHKLTNFVYVDFIDWLPLEKAYSQLFWQRIVRDYDKLYEYAGSAQYHITKKKFDLTNKFNFIIYYVSNHACVKANDGNYYRSADLYASMIWPHPLDFLKIADIGAAFTKEQAEFFHFKTIINLTDCLLILTKMKEAVIKSEISKNYVLVFENILHLKISNEEKMQLKNWPGYLMAEDNSWQERSKLTYFNSIDGEVPHDPAYIKRLPKFSPDKMLKICNLFNITVFDQKNVKYIPVDDRLEKNTDSSLTRYLNDRIISIAVIEAKGENIDILEKLKEICNKIIFLKIYEVSQLKHMNNVPGLEIKIYLDHRERKLYYIGRWQKNCKDIADRLSDYLNLSESTRVKIKDVLKKNDYASDQLVKYKINQADITHYKEML
jgi:hypothetical protein